VDHAFDDRVKVCESERTRTLGTAGWHGTVVGISREPDVPSGRIVAYAVAMDEDGEKVWMVEPEDLELT
jgi:hypothetical protein